ncbi:MAG: hypothetical protein IJB00_03615 [Akkermansia sp.]|nr:hypothetical protein [Akkermansia sp.]
MDTESIKEKVADAGQQVRHWMEDKHNRRCCKVAMGAANAVVLLGLTVGLTLLWVNELRRGNHRHHCCRDKANQ